MRNRWDKTVKTAAHGRHPALVETGNCPPWSLSWPSLSYDRWVQEPWSLEAEPSDPGPVRTEWADPESGWMNLTNLSLWPQLPRPLVTGWNSCDLFWAKMLFCLSFVTFSKGLGNCHFNIFITLTLTPALVFPFLAVWSRCPRFVGPWGLPPRATSPEGSGSRIHIS